MANTLDRDPHGPCWMDAYEGSLGRRLTSLPPQVESAGAAGSCQQGAQRVG